MYPPTQHQQNGRKAITCRMKEKRKPQGRDKQRTNTKKRLLKDISYYFILPVLRETSSKIEGVCWSSLNIHNHWIIDEEGKQIETTTPHTRPVVPRKKIENTTEQHSKD